MSPARPARASGAVAAEPLGIGTSGARDPLAVEVRLLGALLGQVITEQAGPELFALVERIRRRTIALRRDDDPFERARLDDELRALDLDAAEAVIGAFGLYFGLVNLAEARARVRALRRRERAARDGILDDSVADAVAGLRRLGRSDAELDALVGRLAVAPVFTAHPTEARRRTTLLALGRCAVLLARLDDPRLTPSEDRDVRRRLREEITLLWRTADLRVVSPTPLDEVRTAMAFFDATLFSVVPRLYRALDAALDPPTGRSRGPASDSGRTGTRAPRVGAFLRPGTWIGGDRDGNPGVTAEITARTRAHPRRPRPARLRGGRHPADADRGGGHGRRPDHPGRSPRSSPATPRSCPRPTGSSAAASPTSRTASASASSPSGCAGRAPRWSARRRR